MMDTQNQQQTKLRRGRPSSSPSPATMTTTKPSVFRSSLCGLFRRSRSSRLGSNSNSSSTSSRTDACSIALCGGVCLLYQRNKFLLTGQKPKPFSLRQRPIEMLLLILVITIIVIAATVEDPFDEQYNDFMWALVGTVIVICIYKLFEFLHKSRILRQRLAIHQWDIIQQQQRLDRSDSSNHSIDDVQDVAIDPELQAFLSFHHEEIYGNGTHALCGCAPSNIDDDDRLGSSSDDFDVDGDDDNDQDRSQANTYLDDNGDFCTDLWTLIAKSCCGVLCQCYCQLCGMCATSQEHRHLRKILPQPMRLPLPISPRTRSRSTPAAAAAAAATSSSLSSTTSSTKRGITITTTTSPNEFIAAADLWQRDYITFQPWMEYYPSILRLRLQNVTSFSKHMQALSTLSFRLVVSSMMFLLIVTMLGVCLPVTFPRWQILVVRNYEYNVFTLFLCDS
jgi:hypothetical protein